MRKLTLSMATLTTMSSHTLHEMFTCKWKTTTTTTTENHNYNSDYFHLVAASCVIVYNYRYTALHDLFCNRYRDHAISNCHIPPAIVIAQQQLHFSQSLYSAVLNETGTDLAGGQHPQPPPGFLHVHCLEPNTSSLITYSIATTEVSNPGPFIVNTSTGELSITADLDYEAQTTYTFTVDCSSSTGMNASARVEIYLLPINEFRPYVTLEGNIIKLYEDEPSIGKILVSPIPGKGRLFLNASDQDAGKDGVLRFYLENNNISESLSFLTINHTSGEVTITAQPDADTQGSLTGFHVFAFSVVACDFSHECYTSNSIIMFLFAADDNPPMFSRHNYSVSILEDDISTVGMIVSNLSCTDGDVGPGQLDHIEFVNATAQVIRHFIIPDPKKGVVFLNQTLDYELIQSIQFTLQCFDTANNSDIATVLVIVKPVNDNQPIFNVPRYFFNISCTTASIQHPIGTVKATDKDIDNGNNLTYFIQYNPYYSVTQDGDIFLRSSVQNVPEFLSLSVNVSDGKFSDSARVFIFFTCKKQQGPYFIPGQKVVTIDESISVNTPVLKVKCNYSEAVPISYSFSSGNTGGIFRVNSTSGIISVANPIPLSDEPYRHYSLEVQCTVNYGTTHLSDSMVIVILIQNATALVSSIPFIIAIVVAAAIIILMAVSGIFIAITKAFRQKRRFVPGIHL